MSDHDSNPCQTMTLTACPVGATWVLALGTQRGAFGPQLGLRPQKIVGEGGVCATSYYPFVENSANKYFLILPLQIYFDFGYISSLD